MVCTAYALKCTHFPDVFEDPGSISRVRIITRVHMPPWRVRPPRGRRLLYDGPTHRPVFSSRFSKALPLPHDCSNSALKADKFSEGLCWETPVKEIPRQLHSSDLPAEILNSITLLDIVHEVALHKQPCIYFPNLTGIWTPAQRQFKNHAPGRYCSLSACSCRKDPVPAAAHSGSSENQAGCPAESNELCVLSADL